MKQTILRLLLIMAVGLSAAACSQNWELPDSDPDAEEVFVTFSLSAESGMVSTRSTKSESDRKISTGRLIDKVVYAVYVKKYDNTQLDENGKSKPTWTGEFELLSQYGDGTPGLGDGQALLPLTDETNEKLLSDEGETLTLRLLRGQEYVIAFWAQNSSCTAYNTKNLEAVLVDYTAGNDVLAPNNDETRDAFYHAYTFVAQADDKKHKVILKRALAQINVGTAGWDWNSEIDYPNLYAYSKIEMTGLYDQLNVLTGAVSKTDAVKNEDGSDAKIVYNWAKLPAYYNVAYPKLKTEWDKWLNGSDGSAEPTGWAEWLKATDNDKEFLWVKLTTDMPQDGGNNDRFWGKYLKYNTEMPSGESEEITTEVFKYLSMCYVLAPTYVEQTDDEGTAIKTAGTTIPQLTFYLAETADGKYRPKDDSKDLGDVSYRFSIKNVPIQRNWRTNILGGTRGSETTLFDPRTVKMVVDLSPGFRDDHNYQDKMNDTLTDEDCKNEDEKGSAPAQGAE